MHLDINLSLWAQERDRVGLAKFFHQLCLQRRRCPSFTLDEYMGDYWSRVTPSQIHFLGLQWIRLGVSDCTINIPVRNWKPAHWQALHDALVHSDITTLRLGDRFLNSYLRAGDGGRGANFDCVMACFSLPTIKHLTLDSLWKNLQDGDEYWNRADWQALMQLIFAIDAQTMAWRGRGLGHIDLAHWQSFCAMMPWLSMRQLTFLGYESHIQVWSQQHWHALQEGLSHSAIHTFTIDDSMDISYQREDSLLGLFACLRHSGLTRLRLVGLRLDHLGAQAWRAFSDVIIGNGLMSIEIENPPSSFEPMWMSLKPSSRYQQEVYHAIDKALNGPIDPAWFDRLVALSNQQSQGDVQAHMDACEAYSKVRESATNMVAVFGHNPLLIDWRCYDAHGSVGWIDRIIRHNRQKLIALRVFWFQVLDRFNLWTADIIAKMMEIHVGVIERLLDDPKRFDVAWSFFCRPIATWQNQTDRSDKARWQAFMHHVGWRLPCKVQKHLIAWVSPTCAFNHDLTGQVQPTQLYRHIRTLCQVTCDQDAPVRLQMHFDRGYRHI